MFRTDHLGSPAPRSTFEEMGGWLSQLVGAACCEISSIVAPRGSSGVPHVDGIPPGAFSWAELQAKDIVGAKQFYSALFGWTTKDICWGPDMFQTHFQLEGRDVAGCALRKPDTPGYRRRKDLSVPWKIVSVVPARWQLIVCVESLEVVATKAITLGPFYNYDEAAPPRIRELNEASFKAWGLGALSQAGRPEMGYFGDRAMLRDPTSASIFLSHPKCQTEFGIAGEPGTFCWGELVTSDPQDAAKYYSHLLGWKIEAGQQASGCFQIKDGENFGGRILPRGAGGGCLPPNYSYGLWERIGRRLTGAVGPELGPHWRPCFLVTDCDASVAKAGSLGARTFVPPTMVEGLGRWAVLADPHGAPFSVFQAALTKQETPS